MFTALIIITYLITLFQIIGLWAIKNIFDKFYLSSNIEDKVIEVSLWGIIIASSFAGILSIFIPLGLYSFLIVNFIAVFFVIMEYSYMKEYFRDIFKFKKPTFINAIIFCIIFLIPILYQTILSPTNSDTGHNHLPCIRWMENYKAVPGLANLFIVYGNYSSWFWLNALLGFSFIGKVSYYLLNPALMALITYYFVESIRRLIKTYSLVNSIRLIIFINLIYYFIYWHRLASVTYEIAYTCIIVYLFIQIIENRISSNNAILKCFIISIYLFTVKQTAFPVIILSLIIIVINIKKIEAPFLIKSLIASILIITPLVIRNVINSGYLIYPYTFANVLEFDWKVPINVMEGESKYIEIFAKLISSGKSNLANDYYDKHIPFSLWFSDWFRYSHVYFKIVYSFALVGFLLFLVFFRKHSKNIYITFIVCVFACFVWLLKSPIPRYAFPYLIIIIAIGFSLLINELGKIKPFMVYGIVFSCLLLIVKCYFNVSTDKLKSTLPFNYNSISLNINSEPIEYNTLAAQNLYVKIPKDQFACFNELICTPRFNKNLECRGRDVQDGFRIYNSQKNNLDAEMKY